MLRLPLMIATSMALVLAACTPEYASEEPAGASVVAAENATTVTTKPVLAGVDLSAPLSLVGTEPVWGVKIADSAAVLSRMDQVEASFSVGDFTISGDTATVTGGALSIALTATTCSDGMSDRKYPLTAEVKVGEEILRGCAMGTAELMSNPV